ncbi:hypothetical protein K8R66_03810 [bacterium]|nr:hypothetical protein [bacterium]
MKKLLYLFIALLTINSCTKQTEESAWGFRSSEYEEEFTITRKNNTCRVILNTQKNNLSIIIIEKNKKMVKSVKEIVIINHSGEISASGTMKYSGYLSIISLDEIKIINNFWPELDMLPKHIQKYLNLYSTKIIREKK